LPHAGKPSAVRISP